MAVQGLESFDMLWVHTGSTCNLSCPFCHEGSSPGDQRIGAPSAAQLLPYLAQAAALGVRRFGFTGGEPLIHREIVPIVQAALALAPCLILTNGTAPLLRRPQHLALWRGQPHALVVRVSIDHPQEAEHDAGRGLKNFRKALEGLQRLHEAGFEVGITRQCRHGEDAAAIALQFRQLLRRHRLPEDLPVIGLPELGTPGLSSLDNAAWSRGQGPGPTRPACAHGRMLLVRDGSPTFQPCPLVDDQPRFDLGPDLIAALRRDVVADHARCTACRQAGVDYAGPVTRGPHASSTNTRPRESPAT